MTKLKTFIAALLIGTSSMATVAAAQPSSAVYEVGARDHRSNSTFDNGYRANVAARFDARFGWNDGREVDPGYVRHYPPQPQAVALQSSVPVVGGQQETWLIGDRVGSLRIDVTRGAVFVSKIAVELGNGQMLLQQVNRTLTSRTSSDPLIDLAGVRDIRRVIVYTPNGGNGATYDIVSC
jgi:hypothetical protein